MVNNVYACIYIWKMKPCTLYIATTLFKWCRAVLDVVVKPSSGLSGPRQRQLEQLISGCCGTVVRKKVHPHTAISVTLQVENDGGSVSSRHVVIHKIRCWMCVCVWMGELWYAWSLGVGGQSTILYYGNFMSHFFVRSLCLLSHRKVIVVNFVYFITVTLGDEPSLLPCTDWRLHSHGLFICWCNLCIYRWRQVCLRSQLRTGAGLFIDNHSAQSCSSLYLWVQDCKSILTFVTSEKTGDIMMSFAEGDFTLDQVGWSHSQRSVQAFNLLTFTFHGTGSHIDCSSSRHWR